MNRLLLALSVAFLMTAKVDAQNAKKTHFMLVSIHYGSGSSHPEIIVTKEGGPQQITKAGKNSWMSKSTFDTRANRMEANEDSIFLALKPYFDGGWQLASSTIIRNTSYDDYVARYYFTRRDD
jgi:hypothetical protein